MKSVFIGGSRKLSRLNEQIRAKLAEITERRLHVVVGDANGADRAVQAQLSDWGYENVTVYFVGAAPRNNEGAWPTERVAAPPSARGAEFYGAKDIVMARAADAGLMLWDGESSGTLANVKNLVHEEKPVAVYVAKQRRFRNVLNEAELRELTSSVDGVDLASTEPEEQSELPLGVAGRSSVRKRRRRAV